jgi:hypothetical protein
MRTSRTEDLDSIRREILRRCTPGDQPIYIPGREPLNGKCWIWNGTDQGGTPVFWTSMFGKLMTVRRLMWIITHREQDEDGAWIAPPRVLSLCGNRLCVSPQHIGVSNKKNREQARARAPRAGAIVDRRVPLGDTIPPLGQPRTDKEQRYAELLAVSNPAKWGHLVG